MKTVIFSVVKWIAGFFQDGKNSASSKRATLYISIYLVGVIVLAAIDGKWENNSMNAQIFWGLVFIILFCVDAIKRESISKILESKFGNKQ